MAFDQGLAQRIREVLEDVPGVVEKKMFGGVAFMLAGHMFCGIVKDDLMVRVGVEREAEALQEPHARRMDFTGKPMKGYVYVGPRGVEDDRALLGWIHRGRRYVEGLPPKD